MNSVVLIGRLTRDPELRYIPESQNAVATFTLAVDRPMSREKTADFIRITVFGKSAENCAKYLVKGRLVAVNGRIQTGSYKNKNGDTVYTTDVIANNVEFLEWGDKGGPRSGESYESAPSGAPASMGSIPEGFQAIDDDDDIPF